MAAGRTSRPGGGAEGPRSGLCVVINGNLKQRELTISFFISSPMLSAPEVRRTPTRTAQIHVHTDTHGLRGMLFAPTRVDLLLERW